MGKNNITGAGLGFHAIILILVSVIVSSPKFGAAKEKESQAVGVNVGVVLDSGSVVGKLGLSSIKMAVSDFYGPNGKGSSFKTRLLLKVKDSKKDVILAAASALDHIKNEHVKAIIGPSTSDEAAFVANLGDKAQVPILTFSATSPTLSFPKNAYFFRTAQSDSAQAHAIAALIQAFGWREAVPIYIDTMYGRGLFPSLTDALEGINARVPYRSVLSVSANDDQILGELYKLMTMQTRVFVVHMNPTLGARLFQKAKQIGMMEQGYVWITTDGITNLLGSMSPSVVSSAMQGVLGVRTYVPQTPELENFTIRWKKSLQQDNDMVDAQLNVYALWAYDATMALATAIERVGASINALNDTVARNENLTDLEAFGVSPNGPSLRTAILDTSFQGVSGGFSLADGRLPVSTFQIVNVIGSSARGIGFWTEQNGISRELNSRPNPNAVSTTATAATAANNLGTIVWPGASTTTSPPPKGWVVPTNGRRLKILVPVKVGFTEFVKVPTDSNKLTKPTGYCIDIFNAVMDSLGYSVPYDFYPFPVASGSYDDMIQQVYLQKYDAVVGDTTIRANRSQYVDFTLPYSESGVALIVPMTGAKRKITFTFLEPLTKELWFTIFGFFIFIGFVIWVLEHRINDDFRGPPGHQAGTMLWFSFSAMVFAQRERVVSNMARFVGIVWVFVLLVLTQSYTASLTSMITVQQLKPTVSNIYQLLETGQHIGYQQGSFVEGMLKQMQFPDSKLRAFSSMEEFDKALKKGSENGGVAGVLDEIAYIKLFLSKHHSKYAMVQPTYKTDGFGFVFPKGSPLVSDVSRAILSVTEGDLMNEIEAKYITQPNCSDTSCLDTSDPDTSLGLHNFSGLFLIAGVAATSALLHFIGTFLYQHSRILIHPSAPNNDNNNGPDYDTQTVTPNMINRVVELVRRFDSKDLSSHTFRDKGSPLGLVNIPLRDHGTWTTDPTADAEINHNGIAVAQIAADLSGPANEEGQIERGEGEVEDQGEITT